MNILKRFEDDKSRGTSEKVVFAILNELLGRSGFDSWWYDIDEGTKVEILIYLVDIVEKI